MQKKFRLCNQIISSDILSVLSHLLKIYRNFPTGFVSTPKLNFCVSIDIFALFCIIKI